MKFDDVWDLVLSEEVWQKESSETSTSLALHLESRGKTMSKLQTIKYQNLNEENLDQERKTWSATIATRKVTSRRTVGHQKKNIGAQESINMTEEASYAMTLSINSPIETWTLDLGAFSHSTSCREIIENYVNGHLRKVYLADDKILKFLQKWDI